MSVCLTVVISIDTRTTSSGKQLVSAFHRREEKDSIYKFHTSDSEREATISLQLGHLKYKYKSKRGGSFDMHLTVVTPKRRNDVQWTLASHNVGDSLHRMFSEILLDLAEETEIQRPLEISQIDQVDGSKRKQSFKRSKGMTTLFDKASSSSL